MQYFEGTPSSSNVTYRSSDNTLSLSPAVCKQQLSSIDRSDCTFSEADSEQNSYFNVLLTRFCGVGEKGNVKRTTIDGIVCIL